MGPRWKGKGSEAKALSDPMSKIVLQLQSSLIQSDSQALLCGCSVLLAAKAEVVDLLCRACFGEPFATAEKDKQWFQLGMEEAFYLSFTLKCIKIVCKDNHMISDQELWQILISKNPKFPEFYKAYSHLRRKNWVVMSGVRYGVDFVAYQHHPALVHSEFAVLVLSEGDCDANSRLRTWSDIHCTTRLCAGVVKTLLVLNINQNGVGSNCPSCVEEYIVSERTIARWIPEKCREDHTVVEKESESQRMVEKISK